MKEEKIGRGKRRGRSWMKEKKIESGKKKYDKGREYRE